VKAKEVWFKKQLEQKLIENKNYEKNNLLSTIFV
jgi:hypothetical protein